MRLVFTRLAADDLDDIIDYIALDNPPAAKRVYQAIAAAAEGLRELPHIGRPGRLPGTRELSVDALPYIIVYQVDADTVTILAVFHGARDLPRALRERREILDDGK